jgi:uridine kinase
MRREARPFLVGIAGGSGSGKTTLARALVETLASVGVAVVSHDAYYRDRSGVAGGLEMLDWDVPEALDQPAFLADLHRLRSGASVRPPCYCFASHRRLGRGPRVVARPVVLVEGILLFHDPDVRATLDFRIFLDAPVAVRAARRLARDTAERGRTRDTVLRQLAASVHPAHATYVEPTKVFADLILLTAGPLPPLVEVASTVIRARLAARAAVARPLSPGSSSSSSVMPIAPAVPGAERVSA